MGEMVEFPVNGTSGHGYLAKASGGEGSGVIVIQEWWGLVDHIKEVCDRFAEAGFTALAPDFYHGTTTTSPDEAGKLMMAIKIDEVEKDLRGAIGFLLSHDACSSSRVGTVGFCMGGQLALYAACANPDQVGACVDFYGIHPDVKPDFARLDAPVLGFFAEKDEMVPKAAIEQLDAAIKGAGGQLEYTIFKGVDHAFFNDQRPEVYHEKSATECWNRMKSFFSSNLV